MIEVAGLGKRYRTLLPGRRPVDALVDVSLSLAPGEVVGLAGPNGAGKSTLLSLLLGFLHPTAGTVTVGGRPPRAYVERHGVGYLPELVLLPPRWTVAGALARLAALGGLGDDEARTRTAEALAAVGLEEKARAPVRQLSKGMLQRLGLGLALLGDRDLLVLDEPTHGLDPVWTQRFRGLVAGLRRPGRLIVVASHNLDELERIADRVIILGQGRVQRIVSGRADATGRGSWRLALGNDVADVAAFFPGATAVAGRPREYRVPGDAAELNRGLAALIGSGGLVVAFEPEESALERAFRDAVGGDA